MKKFSFILVYLISNFIYSQEFVCGTINDETKLNGIGCDDWLNFAPLNPSHTPIKYVRIAIHVFNKNDGTGNFPKNSTSINWITNYIVSTINNGMTNLDTMNLPTSSPYIQDSRIRYVLDTIYFHDYDYGYYFNFTYIYGSSLYSYILNDSTVRNKYSAVHIFLGEDNNSSNPIHGMASGIGDKKWIILSKTYEMYLQGNFWSPSNTLKHELGHSLGLNHTWNGDECDDTPNNPNCWNGDTCSNNMMDYNACVCALTECQLGRMHYYLMGKAGNISDCLIKDYCTYSSSETIIINTGEDVVWLCEKYLKGDLVINNNAKLTIKCKISLPQGAKIIVNQGSELVIDGGIITNSCNNNFQAIEVHGGGKITTKNNAKILFAGNGKILIDSSSNGVGKFYYNKGSYLSLADDSTYIDIKGNLYIGDSANFNFTGNGYVRFSSSLNPSKNIFYGSGSSITLTGSGQSDKIMEIAQETVYMPNCTLSNGLVYMQNAYARMQAATETTTMNLDNIKFSPLGTSRTQQRGLHVWGNQYCTINNCTFENGQYGIYGYLTYGGNSLSISNCNFINNTYGIWVHDNLFNASGCTFTKNDYGVYAEYTSLNTSNIDDCYFTGNPNRNKYPIRYINCDGGLNIGNSYIYDADATSFYSINSSGNYTLRLYCTTISNPGSSTYALNLANGTNLIMSTNSSRSGYCSITAGGPIRLTNAYNINIDNGYNYLNKNGGYHIYGNITAYPCNGMPSLYLRNNQWNDLISNLIKNNNCSPPQNFTLITNPTATYTSCNLKSYVGGTNDTTKHNDAFMEYDEDNNDWHTLFNHYAQTFVDSLLTGDLQNNIKLYEDSWENMRYCLKMMYGLKQLNDVANTEFNRTIIANHKMQQLQNDNYYRLFQLRLEEGTLYRMAGDYDKAIELVGELASDTCVLHKEQVEGWLCILQLEKRISQGLISPNEIEKERANCPMYQEVGETQLKSFINNELNVNTEENTSWINIIPNPTSEEAILCINNESETPCEVEITNILGKHIESISVSKGYSETIIHLKNYSKGIYFATLKNNKKIVIQRFLVK